MFKIRASAVAVLCIACVGVVPAMAQGGRGGHGGQGGHQGPGGPPGYRPGYAAPPHAAPRGQWWDGAYGHGHYYPVTGWRVSTVPSRAYWVPWGGVRYGYYGGVWYAPYGGSLPAFATVVTLGGLGYWYANGVYYREYGSGGYEVVPSPIVGVPDGSGAIARSYVYPKLGQTAEKQASDEYECHRWAVGQTGFDPTAAATGASTVPAPRGDYARAQGACLEGRGYTVR
jgi:hypothetical protein